MVDKEKGLLAKGVGRKKIRAALDEARAAQALVTVTRRIPEADPVEGFVTSVGSNWVALARLGNGIVFDGFALLRIKDLKSVRQEIHDQARVEVRALHARSLWPPPEAAVQLNGFVDAVTSAAGISEILTVFTEYTRPDVCTIGAVLSVDNQTLALLELGPRGRWSGRSRLIDAEDVSRVDFGGQYEHALRLVAGTPPRTDAAL